MIKQILLFFVSLFIGIGLFNWIIGFVGQEEIENAFLVFTGWQGVIIFVLTLLMMLIGNWKWKEILEGEEVKISFAALDLLVGHHFERYIKGLHDRIRNLQEID